MTSTFSLENVECALCIVPPEEVTKKIQPIRERHDRNHKRWPPHINICFPFVAEAHIPDAIRELTRVVSTIAPFELTLEEAVVWNNASKGLTVLLASKPDDTWPKIIESQVIHLFRTLSAPYAPHLTLGKKSAYDEAKKLLAANVSTRGLSFEVKELVIMTRTEYSAFKRVMTIPLLGKRCEDVKEDVKEETKTTTPSAPFLTPHELDILQRIALDPKGRYAPHIRHSAQDVSDQSTGQMTSCFIGQKNVTNMVRATNDMCHTLRNMTLSVAVSSVPLSTVAPTNTTATTSITIGTTSNTIATTTEPATTIRSVTSAHTHPPGGPLLVEDEKQVSGTDAINQKDMFDTIRLCVEKQLKRFPHSPIYYLAGVEPDELWSAFLSGLSAGTTTIWRCTACRYFTNQFGHLVLIGEDNSVHSLFWDPSLPEWRGFHRSVGAMCSVLQSKTGIAGVFDSSYEDIRDGDLGSVGGKYHHMSCPTPKRDTPLSPRAYPELKEMLERVLMDNRIKTFSRAHDLFRDRQLELSDRHEPTLRWIYDIATEWNAFSPDTPRHVKDFFLWRTVGTAFTGGINSLRTGAISTLLKSIETGDEEKETKRKWSMIVDPERYRRPQAPPSTGNVAHAEKLMEEMDIQEKDLQRHFFVYDDNQWRVNADTALVYVSKHAIEQGEIVDYKGIATEKKTKLDDRSPLFSGVIVTPTKSISLMAFLHILERGDVEHVEYQVQSEIQPHTLITGAPGSKLLMQWHTEENRVSWYTYPKPCPPASHNLVEGAWTPVQLIARFPNQWTNDAKSLEQHARHGTNWLVALRGARDTHPAPHGALFDEIMLSRFHPIRTTLSAWCTSHPILMPLSSTEFNTSSPSSSASSSSTFTSSYVVPTPPSSTATTATTRISSPTPTLLSPSTPVCGVAMGPATGDSVYGGTHVFRVTFRNGIKSVYQITTYK